MSEDPEIIGKELEEISKILMKENEIDDENQLSEVIKLFDEVNANNSNEKQEKIKNEMCKKPSFQNFSENTKLERNYSFGEISENKENKKNNGIIDVKYEKSEKISEESSKLKSSIKKKLEENYSKTQSEKSIKLENSNFNINSKEEGVEKTSTIKNNLIQEYESQDSSFKDYSNKAVKDENGDTFFGDNKLQGKCKINYCLIYKKILLLKKVNI